MLETADAAREPIQSPISHFNVQLRIISACVMIDTKSADNATDWRDVGREEQRPEHATLWNTSNAWLLTSG